MSCQQPFTLMWTSAQELKAKKAEMARLRIQLQQAENRNIALQRAAAEREQQRRESEDFEAMKLRVLQLERLVADKAVADPAAVGLSCLAPRLACHSCPLQRVSIEHHRWLLACFRGQGTPLAANLRADDRRMISCGVKAR